MYDTKEFDKNKLEFLRKTTFLGPIAMFRIARAKKEADKFREWYREREGELLEADYSVAEELEYEIRFNAYQNSMGRLWAQYGDGLGLQEFAEMTMEQHMNQGRSR